RRTPSARDVTAKPAVATARPPGRARPGPDMTRACSDWNEAAGVPKTLADVRRNSAGGQGSRRECRDAEDAVGPGGWGPGGVSSSAMTNESTSSERGPGAAPGVDERSDAGDALKPSDAHAEQQHSWPRWRDHP
ncbi:hypothetical protein THAOC_34001, partial [Thalassiosira oceanica]